MKLPHYWLMPSIKTEMTPEKILNAVCDYYNVSAEQIKHGNRIRKLVDARKICVNLMTEMLDLSLYQIGKAVGYRDHSTVIYCNNKHKDYLATDEDYRNSFMAIKTRLEL